MSETNALTLNLPFELRSLARAHHYQGWVADTVRPYLGRRICEIGAGIGNMSQRLPVRELLLLTEADPSLLRLLEDKAEESFGREERVQTKLWDLNAPMEAQLKEYDLDTIVSFNVLEHIEDDVQALRDGIELLSASRAPGTKRLLAFVPAHSWAYGSLDKTFGHFRRYSARSFRNKLRAAGFRGQAEFQYFNLFGLPGWVVFNRILGATSIDENAVSAFERLCPWVRGIDDFIHRYLRIPLGQSLLAVLTL